MYTSGIPVATCVGCLRLQFLACRQVGDVVASRFGATAGDSVELFTDQPGGVFGTSERSMVDRRQRDPTEPLPQQGGLAAARIRQFALVRRCLAVTDEIEVAGGTYRSWACPSVILRTHGVTPTRAARFHGGWSRASGRISALRGRGCPPCSIVGPVVTCLTASKSVTSQASASP